MAGSKVKIPERDAAAAMSYAPKGDEKETHEFVQRRITSLKEHRKKQLPGLDKSIEDIYREADQEYQPHELSLTKGARFESNDETGLRSRLVKVGASDGWQSNMASPDFYVKVNTALSILVDQNPEAVFSPSSKKFEASNALAYGMWKNSWEVSGAKQQLKNFIFNMAKYGTGFMRTYPKLVKQEKKVRKEYYEGKPDKDVYESKTLIRFNDLCRESLNPWQVWISEQARPGDYLSGDDFYFEKDYSWDKFQAEFGEYKNIKFVNKGAKMEDDSEVTIEKNPDVVTVGFYENQTLDIYAVTVPSSSALLYSSPLQNDDGMMSLTFSPWTLRDDRIVYGIGLWEVIRNDSVAYDRLMNMTMDQLVLSIYKMFFYKGTDVLGENGELVLSPGVGHQSMDPKGIEFLNVPGPGQEAWKGLLYLQDRKDTSSGVTPQLAGKFGGNTLGQDIQGKEAALERMKTPLDYICDALQQEAYLTISWQKQILSTPEILEFTSAEDLTDSLLEMGLTAQEIATYIRDLDNPNPKSELLFEGEPESEDRDAMAGVMEAMPPAPPKRFANVYKEVPMKLDLDKEGRLFETDKTKFFRFGVDLPTHRLEWKGIVRIKPQSVLAPSKELDRRMKLDLYNLVMPAINLMLATPRFIPIMLPPTQEIIKTYDVDEKAWIDKDEFMELYEESMKPAEPPTEPPKMSVSIKFETLTPEVQKQMLEKFAHLDMKEPLFVKEDGSAAEKPAAENPNEGPSPEDMMMGGGNGAQPSPIAAQSQAGGLMATTGMSKFKPLVERSMVGGGQSLNPAVPRP